MPEDEELKAQQKELEEKLQQEQEWKEIEDFVMEYQKQFKDDGIEQRCRSDSAAWELLKRFMPIMKKYVTLLRSGQINWKDKEQKGFVHSFLGEKALKMSIKNWKQKTEKRDRIYRRFNFIKETYGSQSEEDIMLDLQLLMIEMAKRYKQMGRSFCAYIYRGYRYEVCRHVRKFIKNPINIPYRNIGYDDYMCGQEDVEMQRAQTDPLQETEYEMPNLFWISGQGCSDSFSTLTPLERKLIVKYYLEDWNDRQIAEVYGLHINTVNLKRRVAVAKLAEATEHDISDIKRNRKSGRNAVMPAD